MINSRRLEDLLPVVRTKVECMISKCKEANIDLLVTSTYRDHASQNALYEQGRTKPGKIVTNAKGGQSFHNFRCAVDVVPIVNGKPVWDAKNPLWQHIGAIGKSCGLEWAGEWRRFKEYPHFQYTGGLTLADLQNGKEVK